MLTQVTCHTNHLFTFFIRRGHSRDGTIIIIIHYHYVVELGKVGFIKLSGMTVETIAMSGTTTAHTTIGQLPYVPRTNGSRINIELTGQSFLLHLGFHDAFGSRRTANITQTNKQYGMITRFHVNTANFLQRYN